MKKIRIRPFTLFVMLVVVTTVGVMILNKLDSDISQLKITAVNATLLQKEVESQKSELEREISIADTDGYIRTQARNLYGYLLPGEIRFVVTNTDALYNDAVATVVEVGE